MRRVVFYIESDWAFGSIHFELCKYLFKHNINATILPWEKQYSIEEMNELTKLVDIFVTTPHGYRFLNKIYGIESNKIIIVAHAILDIFEMIEYLGRDEFEKPYKYAVISKFLKNKSKNFGIKRIPNIVNLGINYGRYFQKPAETLNTIGVAGAYKRIDPHNEYDIKRGYLISKCAEKTGLKLKIAMDYHHSFVTMPGFYSSVDCIINASTEEGGGLPALEAGAAGRLVISTKVGHWNDLIKPGGGIGVPLDEDKFINETVRIIEKYKDNAKLFKKRCREIQIHAESYDWDHVIDDWVELIG